MLWRAQGSISYSPVRPGHWTLPCLGLFDPVPVSLWVTSISVHCCYLHEEDYGDVTLHLILVSINNFKTSLVKWTPALYFALGQKHKTSIPSYWAFHHLRHRTVKRTQKNTALETQGLKMKLSGKPWTSEQEAQGSSPCNKSMAWTEWWQLSGRIPIRPGTNEASGGL